jgi:sRNA-binding carbon storage regulator CsrA
LIGESVVLTVTAMKGGKVQLGFEAPCDVAIVREELGDGRRVAAAGRKHTELKIKRSNNMRLWTMRVWAAALLVLSALAVAGCRTGAPTGPSSLLERSGAETTAAEPACRS